MSNGNALVSASLAPWPVPADAGTCGARNRDGVACVLPPDHLGGHYANGLDWSYAAPAEGSRG